MNKPAKPVEPDQVLGKVEIRKIGNSSGVILSKEMLARLGLQPGDQLYASRTSDGGVRLSPTDPHFERAMEIARRGMKRYHNALAELAK